MGTSQSNGTDQSFSLALGHAGIDPLVLITMTMSCRLALSIVGDIDPKSWANLRPAASLLSGAETYHKNPSVSKFDRYSISQGTVAYLPLLAPATRIRV